jgi:hypothetical protein
MLLSRQKRPGVKERTRITGKYSGREENDGPVRNKTLAKKGKYI